MIIEQLNIWQRRGPCVRCLQGDFEKDESSVSYMDLKTPAQKKELATNPLEHESSSNAVFSPHKIKNVFSVSLS